MAQTMGIPSHEATAVARAACACGDLHLCTSQGVLWCSLLEPTLCTLAVAVETILALTQNCQEVAPRARLQSWQLPRVGENCCYGDRLGRQGICLGIGSTSGHHNTIFFISSSSALSQAPGLEFPLSVGAVVELLKISITIAMQWQ